MSSKKRKPNKDTVNQKSEEKEEDWTPQGTDAANTEMIEQFERELNWCIDQVVMGLETQKPDSRQAKEAEKVLKTLTNRKAPVIKKRQVMRNTFGDYRKKMQEQDKKSAAVAKKIKLSAVSTSDHQQSMFFKKSASKVSDQSKLLNATGTDQSGERSINPDDQSEASLSSNFKFNFTISDNAGEDKNTGDNPETLSQKDSKQSGDTGETKGVFFKSDNSFKFKFSVGET